MRRIIPSEQSVQIYIDGAARGNPGAAACGIVIKTVEGKLLKELWFSIGKATNNFAEYQALLGALRYALQQGYRRVRLYSDSQLLTRQIQGKYKVRKSDLMALHRQACEMIERLESFSISHIPREKNGAADRLANLALDSGPEGPQA